MINFMYQVDLYGHKVPRYFVKYSGCVCEDVFDEITILIGRLE
jgi:hypothetical protein